MEHTFQKQYEALQCLKCYGNEILADETNLTKCENQPETCFLRDCTPSWADNDKVEEECPHGGRGVDLVVCERPPPPVPCCECQFDNCVPGAPTGNCFKDRYFGNY